MDLRKRPFEVLVKGLELRAASRGRILARDGPEAKCFGQAPRRRRGVHVDARRRLDLDLPGNEAQRVDEQRSRERGGPERETGQDPRHA